MLRGLAVDRGATRRGPTVNRGGTGRGVPSASILDSLDWYVETSALAVDATTVPDLAGSNDGTFPAANPAAVLTSAMGALQSVSGLTNEGSVGASLWSTPHDAAMVPTESISLRARWRAIGDPSDGGAITQSVGIRKELSTDPLVTVWDLCLTNDGKIRFALRDDTDTYRGVDAGSGLDWLEDNTIRVDYTLASGAYAMFTSADDGDTWTPFASGTLGPYVPDTDAGPLCFQVGKSVGKWAEMWVDGVLVSRFDVDDTEAWDGSGTTVVSSATGETWTSGNDLVVVPVTRTVVYANQQMVVSFADDPVLDVGTGDFTAIWSGRTFGSGLTAGFYMVKTQGSLGSTGIGYLIADLAGAGGTTGAVAETTNLAIANADPEPTPGDHVYVLRRTDTTIDFFVDGVNVATASSAALGSLDNTGALTLSSTGSTSGAHHLIYAAGLVASALSDAEVSAVTALLAP